MYCDPVQVNYICTDHDFRLQLQTYCNQHYLIHNRDCHQRDHHGLREESNFMCRILRTVVHNFFVLKSSVGSVVPSSLNNASASSSSEKLWNSEDKHSEG